MLADHSWLFGAARFFRARLTGRCIETWYVLALYLPRLAVAATRTPPMPYPLIKLAESHW